MSSESGATVFSNAQVFDGESFLDGPHDLVVSGGAVAGLAPYGQLDHPDGAHVVDCAGRTLTPGLIDCHVHVMTGGGLGLSAFADPFSVPFYRSTAYLRDTLAAGITTARDAGGADLGIKVALAEGAVAGPRLRIAVTVMSQTGGHGDGWLPSGCVHPFVAEHPGRPSGVADGVDAVRATARRILRAGADQIKICSTGGVLSPADDPRHSQFTAEEIAVIVQEAEEQDRYVMAHAQGTPGIIKAVRAGVRSIEHGIYLTDEAIELMLQHDTFLVPTLQAPLQVIRNAEAGMAMIPATVDKARVVVEHHSASIARAYQAGVKIAMGTDAGVGPHGTNLEELELLAGVGLSTTEVLRAATSTAAELMRLDDVGRLAPGAVADLLVIGGDVAAEPLDGIAGRVEQVWQAGRRFR